MVRKEESNRGISITVFAVFTILMTAAFTGSIAFAGLGPLEVDGGPSQLSKPSTGASTETGSPEWSYIGLLAPTVISCTTSITGTIDTNDPVLTGRHFRDGIPDQCNVSDDPCSIFTNTGLRHYDIYTYTAQQDTCVVVSVNALTCTGTQFIYSAAYIGPFDPSNICVNYVASSGDSPNPSVTYSFEVLGGQTFNVVVYMMDPGATCPSYNISITGNYCPATTATPTTAPSNTATSTPTATRTVTSTSTATRTNTAIATSTFTSTPTPTLTTTSTSTTTRTSTSTVMPTSTGTNTAVVPPSATSTTVPATSTSTTTRTSTSTSTSTATRTSTGTNTVVVPPSVTSTAVPATNTVMVLPTATGTSTAVLATSTVQATATTQQATTTRTTVPATATPCTTSFSDVPITHAFYTWIRCLACRGVISGYADATFKPDNAVTRGQLSKIVSNAARFNEPRTSQTYEDVPTTHTFHVFIERLTARGAIGGYSCGSPGEPCVPPANRPYFRPHLNISRGQIAKIVSEAAGITTTPTGQTYEDVPPEHPFYIWIERLTARGVMGGYPCSSPGEPCVPPANRPYFRPGVDATRGQASKIVANTFFPNCQTP